MGRRRWQKVGNSSTNRKLVTVLEAPWSPIRSERISVEEEKILAKAEEIRLRQSGFVYRSKQTVEVINSELLKGMENSPCRLRYIIFKIICLFQVKFSLSIANWTTASRKTNFWASGKSLLALWVSWKNLEPQSVTHSTKKCLFSTFSIERCLTCIFQVNLVIFMNGRYSTFKFAHQNSVPLISSGWIEESKKLNSLASTQKHAAVVPDNFRDPIAPRKYKVFVAAWQRNCLLRYFDCRETIHWSI